MSTEVLSPAGWPPVLSPHLAEDRVADQQCIAIYRYVVRQGGIPSTALDEAAQQLGFTGPQVVAAVMRLVELRLLRTDGQHGERLVPVEPQLAAAQLVSPIERFIFQQWELADQLRYRIDTIAGTRPDTDEPVGSIDRLEGVAELRGLLKLTSDVCRDELLVMRPGHDDDNQVLEGLLDACYRVLDRGVTVRIISSHRSRASFAARAKAKRLIDQGAVIRTVSHLTQTSAIFDHSLAVIFGMSDDGLLPTAHRVRNANMVRFLMEIFNQLWAGATPLAAEDAGYTEEITDDLQRSIAMLLAQGLTDEAVARRLGMSVRTCRRHIAGLLRSLGSVSRFQAGVQAATRLVMNEAVRV